VTVPGRITAMTLVMSLPPEEPGQGPEIAGTLAVVATDDGLIRVVDARDATVVKSLGTFGQVVTVMAKPGGRGIGVIVCGGQDGRIAVMDVRREVGSEVMVELVGHSARINGLAVATRPISPADLALSMAEFLAAPDPEADSQLVFSAAEDGAKVKCSAAIGA
jgi:hypothetical protein